MIYISSVRRIQVSLKDKLSDSLFLFFKVVLVQPLTTVSVTIGLMLFMTAELDFNCPLIVDKLLFIDKIMGTVEVFKASLAAT